MIKLKSRDILFFSFFTTFVFYGAQTNQALIDTSLYMGTIVQFIILGAVSAYLFYDKNLENSFFNFEVSKPELRLTLGLGLLFFIIAFFKLSYPLVLDETSYAIAAHRHSVVIVEKFFSKIHYFANFPIKYLIQFTSFISLIILLTSAHCCMNQKNSKRSLIAILCLLFISRFAYFMIGGNNNPHPPLQLLISLVSGIFFGFNDLAFKVPYFFLFFFSTALLIVRIFPQFNIFFKLALIAAINSFPPYLQLATSVDHSLGGAICFLLVLLFFNFQKEVNYFKLSVLISILSLYRTPCFVMFAPLFIAYLLQHVVKEGWTFPSFKKVFNTFSPSLISLPFFIFAIILENPALSTNSKSFTFIQVLKSGVIINSITTTLPVWSLIFILFSFSPLGDKKNGPIKIAFNLISFFVLIFIYYSIDPGLFGLAKYQAEYISPFAILGFFNIIFYFESRNLKKISHTLLILFVLSNLLYYLFDFKSIKKIDISYSEISLEDKNSSHLKSPGQILTALPYPIDEAFEYITSSGFQNSTYTIGISYYQFREIMSGYTVTNYINITKIYKDHWKMFLSAPNAGWSGQEFDDDKNIEHIVIGPTLLEIKNKLLKDLERQGWKIAKIFKNEKYGSSVTVISRY